MRQSKGWAWIVLVAIAPLNCRGPAEGTDSAGHSATPGVSDAAAAPNSGDSPESSLTSMTQGSGPGPVDSAPQFPSATTPATPIESSPNTNPSSVEQDASTGALMDASVSGSADDEDELATSVVPGRGDAGAGVDPAASHDASSEGWIDESGLPPFAASEQFDIDRGDERKYVQDPTLLQAHDGYIYLAWSAATSDNLLQAQADVFLSRTADGVSWSEPLQVTDDPFNDFTPSLAEDDQGQLHMAWWHYGQYYCSGKDCGSDSSDTNRVLHMSSSDGLLWSGEVSTLSRGPEDSLPSLIFDRQAQRLRLFFSRYEPAIDVDHEPSQLGLYETEQTPEGWSEPEALSVNASETNNTYVKAIQRDDGALALTWTRYDGDESRDPSALIYSKTTQTLFATSANGHDWGEPHALSDEYTNLFPDLFTVGHGNEVRVVYTTQDPTNHLQTVTALLPADGTYPDDMSVLSSVGRRGVRIIATRTRGVYLAVWLESEQLGSRIVARFFEL